MKQIVIDRLEGSVAVCESGDGFLKVSLSELPAGVKDGDLLIYEDGKYKVDVRATNEKKELAKKRMSRLFEKE